MIRAIDKLEPFQRAISKAHLALAGVSIDSLDLKPLIAIANSWNEICPGHELLKQLAEEAKRGILEAGGEPVEFNTVVMCDGIAQGRSGMRYCLPHREIITDSVETMVVGEGVFDGAVYMGSCDKIVPGMLNAVAGINLPSITMTAGPCYAQIEPNESKEPRQRFLRGEITKQELIEGTLTYYTGSDICPFLGTASTMGAFYESLDMMLPGSSLIPSSTSMRRFFVREAGRTVMKLVEKQIAPAQIMTKGALENTIALLSAIGGSLNTLIYLPALAAELGLELGWDDFPEITTRTPVPTAIVPDGNQTVVDLHYTGGIPVVLKELRPVLRTDAMTMTGEIIGETPGKAPDGNRDTIHTMEDPVSRADGIQVLHGNLAPDGALAKTSAVPEDVRVFTGAAKVSSSEDECYAAFREKKIVEGDAIVVRYERPKGDPSMEELHRITEIIKGIPRTAVITDGRFSGASGGLSIGYLCPGAADGGPIALVEEGDEISMDLSRSYIHLEVSEEELECRRREWKPLKRDEEKGLLRKYARTISTAREGVTLRQTWRPIT